ncbi:MAG: hypothetical protein ACC645_23545 [Pirellulales bacterium]
MCLPRVRQDVANGRLCRPLQAGALMSILMVFLLLGVAEAGVPTVTSWFDVM